MAEIEHSGWSVSQADENAANKHSKQAQANPDTLQGAKAAPLPGPNDVNRNHTCCSQQTRNQYEDAQLPLCDHSTD
jgi:hypothetical protein